MTSADRDVVIELWHVTKRDAYPYLPLEQEHTLEDDTGFFTEHLEPKCEVVVATVEDRIVGFMATEASLIDRLYVHPDWQRRGVGTALLDEAKRRSPSALTLFTHQKNASARRFYEQHGFRILRLGISPPPESEPDVEYGWP